jgi:hypothetical protein
MIPSNTSLDHDEEDEELREDDMQELPVVKKKDLFPDSHLNQEQVERLRDLLSHQKYFLNPPPFVNRRDWKVLRAWKGIVGRESFHTLKQYVTLNTNYSAI